MRLPDVRELAESIIYSHARDIEYLTLWEMATDAIRYDSGNEENIPDDYWESQEMQDFIDRLDDAVNTAEVEIGWTD